MPEPLDRSSGPSRGPAAATLSEGQKITSFVVWDGLEKVIVRSQIGQTVRRQKGLAVTCFRNCSTAAFLFDQHLCLQPCVNRLRRVREYVLNFISRLQQVV